MDQPTGPRPTEGPRGSLALAVVDPVPDRDAVDDTNRPRSLGDVALPEWRGPLAA